MNKRDVKTYFALVARMRKAVMMMAALVVAIVMTAVPVFAATGVTYFGEDKGFEFSPDKSSLLESFRGLMPGDSVSETIEVKNSSNKEVVISMKALGAEEADADFLSQLDLKLTDAAGTVLFDAASDQTANLTDWVAIGTFFPGESLNINANLTVPLTMGNEYQDAMGRVNWQFKAEEVEAEDNPETDPNKPDNPDNPGGTDNPDDNDDPGSPDDPGNPDNPDSGRSTEAKTGDSSDLIVWSSIGVVATIVATLVYRMQKRRRRTD